MIKEKINQYCETAYNRQAKVILKHNYLELGNMCSIKS